MTISYKEFAKQTKQYITEVQNRCTREYGIGTHERFWYDQRTGMITFINNDIVCVKAKFQGIGSLHVPTKSWLWAWDNESTLTKNKNKMWMVKDFGEKNCFEFFAVPMLEEVSDKRARRLAAMAITILKAEGGYMFQAGNGLVIYLALFDIQKASGWTPNGANN